MTHSKFGFRQKHSMTLVILYFINHIASAIDDHLHTQGVSFWTSVAKAFDTIDREVLSYELSHYGIREPKLQALLLMFPPQCS